jgi:uracil-DNA glycosylase
MTGLVADRLTAWNPSAWPVAQDWRELVAGFLASAQGVQLGTFITTRLDGGAVIYPPQPLHALALTPLREVKVVILGQDPYHGAGQAQGLAFSVPPGVRVPPSLRNIRAEIDRERRAEALAACETADPRQAVASTIPSGDLASWAHQGVLLLNTCMTVEQATPGSHAKAGWEALTDQILAALQGNQGPIVFMLWGAHAQARRPKVAVGADPAPRLFLLANHPSPLSANRGPVPFMGCNHFAQANAFLVAHGATPIDW